MAHFHLAEALSEQGLSLTDPIEPPSPLREDDIPIMDFFVARLTDKNHLRMINQPLPPVSSPFLDV